MPMCYEKSPQLRMSQKYLKHKALNNVSLEIKEGEIFALLGPNGAERQH